MVQDKTRPFYSS